MHLLETLAIDGVASTTSESVCVIVYHVCHIPVVKNTSFTTGIFVGQINSKKMPIDARQLTELRFERAEQAINTYGEVVTIAHLPPLRAELGDAHCCNLKDDLIVPQARPLRWTEVKFRLTQMTDGVNCWFQYVRVV